MTSVTIIDVPLSLPKGWDIADPLPKGFKYSEILSSFTQPKTLADFCISTEALAKMNIPERDMLIAPFLYKQSTNMLYATRGLGKTWCCLQIAISVATGTPFFKYATKQKGRVLIVDGEMTLSELQSRTRQLTGGINEDIEILPSEMLYREDYPINLSREDDQQRFFACLEELKVKNREFDLLIFDNLSSLLYGVDENDNTEMEAFLQFLVQLKHAGYAVLMVHHAGKSGDQRGGSRREDILDTVIKLSKPDLKGKESHKHAGAHFILSFGKTRGRAPQPQELDVKLSTNLNSQLSWSFWEPRAETKSDEALKVIHDKKPYNQNALAEIMELNKSRISQLLKPLRDSGYVSVKGIAITEQGKWHLAEVWPEEYGHYAQTSAPF